MELIQQPPSTGDLYKDLEATFAQLKFTRDGDAWRVAKALRRCPDAERVRETASYYREGLMAWLRHHIPDQDVAAALRSYTSPPPDPLLVELRGLVHTLDVANSVSGKKVEEDKGTDHIGVKGYEGSQIQTIEQRIFAATMALQGFLTRHGAHFDKVTITGLPILGYLQAVLANQNVNTCNNEVATTIELALDQQFAATPAHIEVGLRLLAVGFFDSEKTDRNAPTLPSDRELQAMADALAEAVPVLAGGPGDRALAVETLTVVMPHLQHLIDGSFIAGTAVKRKLIDLHVLVQEATGQQSGTGEQQWRTVATAAKSIKFKVNRQYEEGDSN